MGKRNGRGFQAIHFAADTEDVFYLHTLIQAKADVNALPHATKYFSKGRYRRKLRTPFDIAFDQFNYHDHEFNPHLLILLSCGADAEDNKIASDHYFINEIDRWERIVSRVEGWIDGFEVAKERIQEIFDDKT